MWKSFGSAGNVSAWAKDLSHTVTLCIYVYCTSFLSASYIRTYTSLSSLFYLLPLSLTDTLKKIKYIYIFPFGYRRPDFSSLKTVRLSNQVPLTISLYALSDDSCLLVTRAPVSPWSQRMRTGKLGFLMTGGSLSGPSLRRDKVKNISNWPPSR